MLSGDHGLSSQEYNEAHWSRFIALNIARNFLPASIVKVQIVEPAWKDRVYYKAGLGIRSWRPRSLIQLLAGAGTGVHFCFRKEPELEPEQL